MSSKFLSANGPGHGVEVLLDEAALELALSNANLMADASGKAIVPHFRALADVENKVANASVEDHHRGYDPVTIADREAELAIREIIERHCPQDGIYGEEFGYRQGESGLTWVLDPIDGTRGFVCGMPTWGTLIALYNGTRSILGVLDQPVLGERFVGLLAEKPKAWLEQRGERQLLRCRRTQSLDESLMCTTTPDIFAGEHWAVYERITAAVASTRYGTDCYGYAMLAAGQVDLVIEPALSAYDIQALVPIVKAAGGVISDWSGNEVVAGGNVIAAANRQLHERALSLVQNA